MNSIGMNSIGTPPPPIRLEHVTLRRGGHDVIRDLSGVFAPGSLTAITGPNGAGKSTLLQALCGARPVASGRIDRGGLEARDIALLPQEGRLDRAFPVTCRDVVALGSTARIGLFRRIGPEAQEAAGRALAAVGLEGLGDRSIGALSAGQFQHVLFARTIVRDAPVILLDEPFSTVDAATEADLMAIIRARIRFAADSACSVGPQATASRASSSVWGNSRRTRSRSCSTAITVRPSPCQRRSTASRSAAVFASTALNGSSSRITGASCTSSRANSKRWNWPAESVPMARRSNPCSPTAPSASVALSRAARVTAPQAPKRAQKPCNTTSRLPIGKARSSAACCGKSAMVFGVRPGASIRPLSGACNPASARNSVLLPAPFGPTKAVRLPGSKQPVT